MQLIALRIFLLCFLVPAAVAIAQENSPAVASQDNPFSTHTRFLYGGVEKILLRTAENMPEENYAFKPTEAVRSFGQIVGHVADAQYLFCSIALGEKNPLLKIEKTKTSKAVLVAALKDSLDYCDKAYASVNDSNGSQLVKFSGKDMPKLGVLNVNVAHAMEHYGNLVTYMRLKNMVPPTSDPEFMKELRK
jgi:uncharacterized damage-inducible protein DinB